MTKTVFPNRMAAHVWAQQTQQEGRSSSGNLWFDGPVLYSYRTPIANIVTAPNGESVVLISSETFSVSTDRHISRARSASRHLAQFTVPVICTAQSVRYTEYGGHSANLKFLTKQYADTFASIKRCKDFPTDRTSYKYDSLRRHAVAVFAYADTFGLQRPENIDAEFDVETLIQWHTKRKAEYDSPERAAKREKDRIAREKRQRRLARNRNLELAERLKRWLKGESVNIPPPIGNAAVLRVRGDEVQTSWGASVPVEHARKVFPIIHACRKAGREFVRDSGACALRVGHFTIDEIDERGNIRVGCHFIRWGAIKRIGQELGLI